MNAPKRHHYVPKFLLRQFSNDKKNIELIVLKNGFSARGPIRRQCYENYIHGHDGALETAFSKLEGETANILSKITTKELEFLDAQSEFTLKTFVNYQLQRTLGATDKLNQMTDSLIKAIAKHDSRFPDEHLDKIFVKMKNPFIFNLQNAIKMTPMLLDLKVKVIFNEREIDFLCSDNPVIAYNQFIEHHPVLKGRGGATGLAIKGLQIFMPTSPRSGLFLYDPNTYRVGSTSSIGVGLSKRDVISLNKLQVFNAVNCIYFKEVSKIGFSSSECAQLHKESKERGSVKLDDSFRGTRSDGKESILIHHQNIDVRIGTKFSFCTLIDHHHYKDHDLAIPPLRYSEIVDLQKDYSDYIDSLVKEK